MTAIKSFDQVSKNVRKFVVGKLREHAAKAGAPVDPTGYTITKRDKKGRIVAALIAERFWECFYVDALWIHESLRGKGLGKKLMQMAETKARKQKCSSVYLWTGDWQAPSFYTKLGYKKLAAITRSPRSHKRFAYIKYLSEAKH